MKYSVNNQLVDLSRRHVLNEIFLMFVDDPHGFITSKQIALKLFDVHPQSSTTKAHAATVAIQTSIGRLRAILREADPSTTWLIGHRQPTTWWSLATGTVTITSLTTQQTRTIPWPRLAKV